jgi:hypothetical protein
MELAAAAGDTVEVRRLLTLYLSRDSLPEHAGFLQWRAAHALGDESTLNQLRGEFDSLSYENLIRVAGTAVVEGVGVVDGARAASILATREGAPTERETSLAFAGSTELAMGHTERGLSSMNELIRMLPFPQVEQVVLWYQVEVDYYGVGDSTSAAKAGPALADMLWANVPPESDEEERLDWLDTVCLLGEWSVKRDRPYLVSRVEDALAQRRLTPTDTTLQWLANSVDLCQAEFDALAAASRGDTTLPALVTRLDSLVDANLSDTQSSSSAMLTSAGLKADMGDLTGALATVRRRYYWWDRYDSHLVLVPSLRLEGRLAAEVGDTAGAIRAYQHYLALRYDPDPHLHAEADEVRAELAKLLGEPDR